LVYSSTKPTILYIYLTHYLTNSWIPGTLTNMKQVLPVKKRDMTSYKEAVATMPTKFRNIQQTDRNITAESPTVKSLLPDLIIVFDANRQKKLLTEAKLVDVPTIGICDTDMDPTIMTWSIPANDDSPEGTLLIAEILGSSIREGIMARIKSKKTDEITMTIQELENAETLMKGNGLYAV
jgi:small subunit ribosomal protein S2